MMNTSRVIIKAGSGTYNLLDKKYNKFIRQYFLDCDEDLYERWLTYDSIIKELVVLGKINYFEEVKYRLTGGEDPNYVLSEVINRDQELKAYLWSQNHKLKYYQDVDLLSRFCD